MLKDNDGSERLMDTFDLLEHRVRYVQDTAVTGVDVKPRPRNGTKVRNTSSAHWTFWEIWLHIGDNWRAHVLCSVHEMSAISTGFSSIFIWFWPLYGCRLSPGVWQLQMNICAVISNSVHLECPRAKCENVLKGSVYSFVLAESYNTFDFHKYL